MYVGCSIMQICNLFFLSKIKNSYAHIVALISRIRIIVAVLCRGEKKIHHMKLKYVTFEICTYRTMLWRNASSNSWSLPPQKWTWMPLSFVCSTCCSTLKRERRKLADTICTTASVFSNISLTICRLCSLVCVTDWEKKWFILSANIVIL